MTPEAACDQLVWLASEQSEDFEPAGEYFVKRRVGRAHRMTYDPRRIYELWSGQPRSWADSRSSTGHPEAQSSQLVAEIAAAASRVTGIPAKRVLVVIQNSPAHFAIEGGRVLPAPGKRKRGYANNPMEATELTCTAAANVCETPCQHDLLPGTAWET